MKKTFILIFSLLLLTSCKLFEGSGNKNDDNDLHYMKNIEQVALEESRRNKLSVLQPGDELAIVVSAKDSDVAKPFNQNYSSGEAIRDGSQPAGNTINQRVSSIVPTYLIDSEGSIDFPTLGRISVAGQTVDDFREHLRNRIKRYIIDPSVSVRLNNYRVSVLGEVRSPGKYIFPEGQTTLLEALGMAGDLTIYAKRDDVLVIRNEGGAVQQARIDLTDASFINSPYYHLKQGDVVYVLPNKTQERLSKRDPNNSIYISIASILVTILALVIRK